MNNNICRDAEYFLKKDSLSFDNREFKDASGPSFEFIMDVTLGDNNRKVDTKEQDQRTSFIQNLKYWNSQTQYLSSNKFSNSYYRNIVDKGLEVVPLIMEEIKRGPSFIVHALDEILPGVVEYGEGYIPVEKACETWISILSPIEKN